MESNSFNKIAWFLFIVSIIIISLGILFNEIEFGLFFIFPFFIGSGLFAFIGIILFFLSMIFFFLRSNSNFIDKTDSYIDDLNGKEIKKSKINTGGVVLIGPIPIIFGSNWKITFIMGIIAILFILMMIFFLQNNI